MSTVAFWDKIAPKYAKDQISDMTGYIRTRDRIREIIQPHHHVLELGCGTGSTALELADRAARYTATDLSPKMIEIAKAKQNAETPQQLGFAVQEAGAIPQDGYQIILALNLFHLLPDLEETLGRIHDALPSGGQLISKTSLLKDGFRIIPWIIPLMRAMGKAPYVRNLGKAELLKLLETAGFTITEQLTQKGSVPRLFVIAQKP